MYFGYFGVIFGYFAVLGCFGTSWFFGFPCFSRLWVSVLLWFWDAVVLCYCGLRWFWVFGGGLLSCLRGVAGSGVFVCVLSFAYFLVYGLLVGLGSLFGFGLV